MLAFTIMLMSGTVSLGSVYFAIREQTRINRELAQLRFNIDEFTAGSPSRTSNDDEVRTALHDVFQEQHHAVMVLALNELSSAASLARDRAGALARGMSRIPFLSGGAAALAVIALGRLESASLMIAGICIGTGFVSSLVAQFFAKRARRAARIWGDVVETLSRSVEKRWLLANRTASELV